jgi:hypothetical protein
MVMHHMLISMASAKQNPEISSARDLLGQKELKTKYYSIQKEANAESYSVCPSSDGEKIHKIEPGVELVISVFRDGIIISQPDNEVTSALEELSLASGERIARSNGKHNSTKVNLTKLGASVHDFSPADYVAVDVCENGILVTPIDMEATS